MKRLAMPLLLLFSITVAVGAPFIGATGLSFAVADEVSMRIFTEIRVPRVLLAWITGATLAVCGMIYQALFRNSLASPDMLGVSAGAAFGAVLYIRFGAIISFLGLTYGLPAGAFIGALLATAIIYAAGSVKRGGVSEATLLLAGIAISFLFGSLNMIIQYSSGYTDTFRMMRWSLGGIQAIGFTSVWATLPALLVILLMAVAAAPELNLLVAGEEVAISRGVPTTRLRSRLFLAVSLAVGINVAACGPIGFVGLMVPHICRKLTGTEHRRLTVACALFGGSFLVICDTAARTLWSPAEIPAGVLTSCAGSIFFLWLLICG